MWLCSWESYDALGAKLEVGGRGHWEFMGKVTPHIRTPNSGAETVGQLCPAAVEACLGTIKPRTARDSRSSDPSSQLLTTYPHSTRWEAQKKFLGLIPHFSQPRNFQTQWGPIALLALCADDLLEQPDLFMLCS